MTADLRLTVVGGTGSWSAALRRGTHTVTTCGHSHRNRDSGSATARHCGAQLVRAARQPELAGRWVAAALASAARARSLGARLTDDQARTRAGDTAAAWGRLVRADDLHLPAAWAQANAGAPCGCCPLPAVTR